MSSRLTARAYAAQIGAHEDTVQEWCRNAALPADKRNPRLPPISAIKRGRPWMINVEATERAQAIASGNDIERDLVRRHKS